MLSFTEENYLKALLRITLDNGVEEVGTNELAAQLEVRPATVTDMLKRLKEKKLINYQKYGKIGLNDSGRKIALEILRKHRLWETFLYEKLEFDWDEVHEIAEQLEHIKSPKLINKLDAFLNFPQFDPHGDPIPTEAGELKVSYKKTLAEVAVGETCKLAAVKDNSAAFLQYVVKVGLGISSMIKVVARQDFDDMMQIEVNGVSHFVSDKFASNVFVV
ncbi:iron-dependent repressor [Pelobium manganitolerans]|uniref:Transcriptional regulator MntR n=1 Tax=Pelobium manganitolerans TaxID=1842495 RepID=A0A419S3S7_9SPHI|nr:metal-dependent transcriptional regulator [Pelobium manganitolerans]RKD13830.1 iron-dependent repressor [Pelobium manganitolerans]